MDSIHGTKKRKIRWNLLTGIWKITELSRELFFKPKLITYWTGWWCFKKSTWRNIRGKVDTWKINTEVHVLLKQFKESSDPKINAMRVRNILVFPSYFMFWASLVDHMVNKLPTKQETWVQFLGQEDPLE